MISPINLKDAERVVRVVMITILLTASFSKFMSHGGFQQAYLSAFQVDSLRIQVPSAIISTYLAVIPWIELSLGVALMSNRHKNITVYGWFGFMLSLTVGHYILQEWSAVNDMLDYFFLGLLCFVLPNHQSWFKRDQS
jgi:hypothetical protein